MEFSAAPSALGERIGAYLPGTQWGEEAAQFWATKQVQTGNPLYAVPGLFASLWTRATALDTALILGPDMAIKGFTIGTKASMAAVQFAKQAVDEGIRVSARVLNKGRGFFGAERSSVTINEKYIVTPTLDSGRKLKQFGLDASQRKSFYLGEQVIFEDPATSYLTATIFKYENNTLDLFGN